VVFAATTKPKAPLPDPLEPEVIVIQPVWLDAAHAQPAGAATAIEPAPPVAGAVVAEGETE